MSSTQCLFKINLIWLVSREAELLNYWAVVITLRVTPWSSFLALCSYSVTYAWSHLSHWSTASESSILCAHPTDGILIKFQILFNKFNYIFSRVSLIITKCCTYQDSWAVLVCAIFCCDQMCLLIMIMINFIWFVIYLARLMPHMVKMDEGTWWGSSVPP